MNDASNPQNAYPAFWRRSRLSPKVQRHNFLLLSSPLTTAIGTWKKRQPVLWMSAFVAGAGISQLGHQGLPTARLAHSRASRWRSPDGTDNGHSALAARTGLPAPNRTRRLAGRAI